MKIHKKSTAMFISIIMVIQMFLNLTSFANVSEVVQKDENTPIVFRDIEGHWAEDAINFLAQKNIVSGYVTNEGNEIRPESKITRAEYLAVLLNTRQSLTLVKEDVKTFSDINEGDWYKEIIDKASSNGILEGYPDNTFRPNNPITRAEISSLMMRFNNWVQQEDINSETEL